jgi:hypothetical protein
LISKIEDKASGFGERAKKKQKRRVVASGVREQLAQKKISGADAMGCKIKKRKADPPFSKAYPHQRLQRNLYLLVFFLFSKVTYGC